MRTTKSIILCFISIICFVSPSLSQNKKTSTFINDYLNVAFWNVQGNFQPLVKWGKLDTLKYKIIGDFQYLNEKAWNKYISELETLIEKSIILTKENDYHILIFFGSLQDYSDLTASNIPSNAAEKFNNWSRRKWDKNYYLTRASYCIAPSKIKNSSNGAYKVRKLFLQSLGILGESENQYSIFFKYYSSSNNILSRLDKRLVKLHYNNSLKSGLDKDDVKQILSELGNIDVIATEKL